MCGRFTLHTEKELLAQRFELDRGELQALEPRYNIAPSTPVLTVHVSQARRRAEPMRWGLVPHWMKTVPKHAPMINARAETLASKPAYRSAFRRRRCLILADGFYEWQAPQGAARYKTPYWISLASAQPFAFAGLWEEWRPPGPEAAKAPPLRSCTIVTLPAAATLENIHDRMPLILPPEAESAWLDPERTEAADLEKLLVPLVGQELRARPVSRRVNAVRNDGPELIAPSDDPSLGF